MSHPRLRTMLTLSLSAILLPMRPSVSSAQAVPNPPEIIRAAEAERIALIERLTPSVVCIFDETRTGGGSGVLITPDGFGLTNFHVIASMLEKRRGLGGLADGTLHPLEVVGIDPTGDLALFRLTGDDRFAPAVLGDSDTLRVGDAALALGNPFMLAEDFTPTATFGIISGLHRYQYGADNRSLIYTDCIQVDASINPGNSGGPLFDLQGRLIGINGRASFQKDPRRQRINVGIGYAVSINQIKRFLPDLRAGRLVEHGTLGATVTDTPDDRVVFDKVLPTSTAARAGLRVGDHLIAFDHRPIRTANDLLSILGTYPAGWPVHVRFQRGGQTYSPQLRLDRLPLNKPVPWTPPQQSASSSLADTLPAPPLDIQQSSAADTTPNRFADAAAAALPAVVKIYGGTIGRAGAYGTGVIVSDTGEIVTTLSVLLEATRLRAVTSDGRVHATEVIYRDTYRQLALLRLIRPPNDAVTTARINAAPPPQPIALPERTAARTGDWVVTIGNPFKIADGAEACSVMHGILSGRARLDAVTPGTGEPIAYRGNVLLLDAITNNPGSPGTLVVDLGGRFVGIVGEAVESRLTHTALNYAYPAEEIAAFLADARTGAAATPSYATAATMPVATGPTTQASTAETSGTHRAASAPAAPGYHGITLSRVGYRQRLPFVQSVARGSPADRAGLRSGDLIVSANGTAIARARTFEELVGSLPAGTSLSLVVKRNDELINVRFLLEEPSK